MKNKSNRKKKKRRNKYNLSNQELKFQANISFLAAECFKLSTTLDEANAAIKVLKL